MQVVHALIIILIFLILIEFERIKAACNTEGYWPCFDCDRCNRDFNTNDLVSINPFRWPYSGSSCLPNLRKEARINEENGTVERMTVVPTYRDSIDGESESDCSKYDDYHAHGDSKLPIFSGSKPCSRIDDVAVKFATDWDLSASNAITGENGLALEYLADQARSRRNETLRLIKHNADVDAERIYLNSYASQSYNNGSSFKQEDIDAAHNYFDSVNSKVAESMLDKMPEDLKKYVNVKQNNKTAHSFEPDHRIMS